MTDLSSKALENIGVIIGGCIIYVAPKIETYFKKKKKGSNFISNLKVSEQISKELDHILVKYGASRVSVIEYHNGTSSYAGIPFNFASMSYEAHDPNIYPMLGEFQAVPISPMVNMLLTLNNSTAGYIRTTDQDSDKDMNIIQKVYGTICSYNFKMGVNISEGVLSISWNNKLANLTQDDIDDIKVSIYRIRSLTSKIKKH
jgi:hypothetical protein